MKEKIILKIKSFKKQNVGKFPTNSNLSVIKSKDINYTTPHSSLKVFTTININNFIIFLSFWIKYNFHMEPTLNFANQIVFLYCQNQKI